MQNWNDREYRDLFEKEGGTTGVNRLLREKFSDDKSRFEEMERLARFGWDIQWHWSSSTGERDQGVVMDYRG